MTYTLLEAAQELGFTKNAVKYHVKKLSEELPPTTQETTAFSLAITALTDQLAVKDEQIAALNRQIETLTEALRAAQNTAAAAQALHAGTIQNERLAAPLDVPEQPPENEENKNSETAVKPPRRWWRFGR